MGVGARCMLGLQMAPTASCPSKPVAPEAEGGRSPAGVPVESQRGEDGESLHLAHRLWVVGTSAAVAVCLRRNLRPSLSIPASELASWSHLPPHYTEASVRLLLQDAYFLVH